jgi:predicted ATPase
MQFYVLPNTSGVPPRGRDAAYLWADNWNDWWTYRTLYVLTYFDTAGQRHELGGVKIGQFNWQKQQRRPELPTASEGLDDRFFSLGQDASYYTGIKRLREDASQAILIGLKDVVSDQALFERALNEDVTGVSLLRSVTTRSVRDQFRRIIEGGAVLTEYSFQYEGPRSPEGNIPRLVLDFHVTPYSTPPTNIHVLIGRNGVGKTHLLNSMTRALLSPAKDPANDGSFTSTDEINAHEVPFANIVSVTFSAFDEFALLPERRNVSRGIRYSNIGLRKRVKNRNDEWSTITREPTELAEEFSSSAKLCIIGQTARRWRSALRTLEADPIFSEAEVAALGYAEESQFAARARRLFRRLSSGHKIVLLTITKLVEKVEERTLVLLDEPEAHLHPPLLSAFVRALSDLLVDRNGVAVIATHSPVVVQEVPASCVWIIIRHGLAGRADRPELETFAENVGVLTQEVFGLEVTRSGFHKMLADAVGDLNSIDAVLRKFDNEVGSEGRALVSGLIAGRNVAADS